MRLSERRTWDRLLSFFNREQAADKFKAWALSRARRRRDAYQSIKQTPSWRVVVGDLAEFCRYRESTFTGDGDEQKHLEGRREVFLRLIEHGGINEEEIDRMIEEEQS